MVAALLLGGACATTEPRTPHFRLRPDSTQAGRFRGPFDGRVVDAATGKPIAGALVYATWSLTHARGGAAALVRDAVTSSDARGRYRIKAIPDSPSDRAYRLANFTLVVYKRGFVAYRSDRRFSDLGARRDFAQRENLVPMERWRADLSHVRHLRFVGGGPAIAALTEWEIAEAEAELRGQSLAATPTVATDLVMPRARSAVVAAQLIDEAEIRAITHFDGSFETGPLGDDPDTGSYSSQHFKALGRPESNDLAVRLWMLEPDGAQRRFAALLESLPDAEETGEVADRSLRAIEPGINGVAFLDGRRGIVVLLTCGAAQCSSPEQAVLLAKKMHENLQSLWSPRASASPE